MHNTARVAFPWGYPCTKSAVTLKFNVMVYRTHVNEDAPAIETEIELFNSKYQ
jgi:hypothetical protein